MGGDLAAQTSEPPPVAVEPASPAASTPRNSSVATLLSGAHATVTVAGVHDSSIGWYTVVTPVFSYTFSPRYSADVSLSIYPYRLVETQSATQSATQQLTRTNGDTSDTLLAGHATFYPHHVQNTTTFSLTLPTGNKNDGLGLGTATVDLSNHSERYFGRKGLLLDLGLGDSSGLFNRLIPNQDSTLAPIAHFQAGVLVPMPLQAYLQVTAYEQLPLGDQKLYTAIFGRGGPPTTVVSGRKVTEDNGFANVLSVPLNDHVTLSSFYTRSLRLHLDTVSVGLTYSWKGFGRRKLSLIDPALLEAERPAP